MSDIRELLLLWTLICIPSLPFHPIESPSLLYLYPHTILGLYILLSILSYPYLYWWSSPRTSHQALLLSQGMKNQPHIRWHLHFALRAPHKHSNRQIAVNIWIIIFNIYLIIFLLYVLHYFSYSTIYEKSRYTSKNIIYWWYIIYFNSF